MDKKIKKQKQYKKNYYSFLMYGQIQMWQLRLAVWNNRQSEISIEWQNDNVSRARFFLTHYNTVQDTAHIFSASVGYS